MFRVCFFLPLLLVMASLGALAGLFILEDFLMSVCLSAGVSGCVPGCCEYRVHFSAGI